MRSDELLNPRDAARAMGISYPTLKQWIYKKKLRSVLTAGGHHRIPASEIERFLPRAEEKGRACRAPRIPPHQREKSTGRPHRRSALQRAAGPGEAFQSGASGSPPSSQRMPRVKWAWKKGRPRPPSSSPPKS